MAFLARPVQHARVIVDAQRNRLGELAGRADLAEDHIGERRAAGLAEQPGFEDALGVLGPRGHGDHGAVGQHDHDVLVRGGDLFEQGDLLGGHVEGVAVEAFGFRGFRQAQEHEDNVGVLGGFHGFGFEGRVGRFQIECEAGGEVGLDAALGERVEEAGHLGGGDVGGAAALVARGAGEFADNGDLLGRGGRIGDWTGVQRQNRIIVLEHHNGFNSGLMGDFIVGVHIETVIVDAHCSAGLVYQVNHALSHTIELGGGDSAVADGVDNLVVGVARRHFQIQACIQGGPTVMIGAPVGHDDALEAPFVAQHVGQQPMVLCGMHAVDAVVGAHDGPRLGLLDDVFEGREVDLAQGARADAGIDAQSVGFLIVGGEVLERRAHALGLHAFNNADGFMTGQVRVFGPVFEAATAERVALDIDAGAKNHSHLFLNALLSHRLTNLVNELRIPRAGQAGGRREAGGGHGVVKVGLTGAGGQGLPQTVRTVSDHVTWDAFGLHALQMPCVATGGEGCLLF